MSKRTYGVKGLLEWTTEIKAGKAKVYITFSGGALTAYGVTPAIFKTKNRVIQKVIEHSDYYKQGRIELLSVEADEEDEGANSEQEEANSEQEGANSEQEGANSEQAEIEAETGAQTEAKAEAQTEGNAEAEAEAKAEAVVEVTCLDDAKEHMRDNYGVRNLRTWAEANAAAARYGVRFVTKEK